jgi:hypothetical protein
LKYKVRTVLGNITFLLVCLSFVTSCANLGSASDDTDECRHIAYGKNSKALADAVDPLFTECLRKKESLREHENKRANTAAWIDFFGDLFLPSKD